MKDIITIQSIEQKTSSNNKTYSSIKTDKGQMSCFDVAVMKELNKYIGLVVSVEIQEKNNYKNITGIYVNEKVTEAPNPNQVQTNKSNDNKETLMIMSYVKDLVVAGKVDISNFKIMLDKLKEFANNDK